MAIDSQGMIHLCYFDRDELSLKYAKGSTCDWTVMTVQDDVFVFCDIALDSDGAPHVAYMHRGSFASDVWVGYAYWNGSSWVKDTVDMDRVPGWKVSLAIDGNDTPHLSYAVNDNPSGYSSWDLGDLRYATLNGSTWEVEQVDGMVWCVNTIAVDGSNQPCIAYSKPLGNNDYLHFAERSGISWDIEVVSYADALHAARIALLLDADDTPHIGYSKSVYPHRGMTVLPSGDHDARGIDVADGIMKYTTRIGASWSFWTVDDTPGQCGFYCGIASDSQGDLHLSYSYTNSNYEPDSSELRYARFVSDDPSPYWVYESVARGGDSYGFYNCIGFDNGDSAHICYYRHQYDGGVMHASLVEGTVISGVVAGVLNSYGSPYYVCGDVYVTSNLSIDHGTTLLFAGPYRFEVTGTLNTFGTEEDSILFTRYCDNVPWRGIRFIGADPSSDLRYCTIEYAEAVGLGSDADGAGIYCENTSPTIAHCTIRHNSAQGFGGGICLYNSDSRLDTCLIVDNDRDGLYFGGSSDVLLTNCTIADNEEYGVQSPASEFPFWNAVAINTIIYDNYLGSVTSPCNSFQATYSDIEDFVCGGAGVIDCYPEFVHYYRLGATSCCIDAGDPDTLNNDPDGTRGDIGAFYYDQGNTVCGDVEGLWRAEDSPIHVVCDITVQNGDQLEIEPGVEILFDGNYKFFVYGLLRAMGTGQDSIVFKPDLPDSIWGGIRFMFADPGCSLQYCQVTRAHALGSGAAGSGGGAYLYYSDPVITGCSFVESHADENGGGICCVRSRPTIEQCRFINNSAERGGGVSIEDYSDPVLTGCIVSGCRASWGGGLSCLGFCNPRILWCAIWGNSAFSGGGGLYCTSNCNPNLMNCTMTMNFAMSHGGAICLTGFCDAHTINTIMWNDEAPSGPEIALMGTAVPSFVTIEYCDLQGGLDSIYIEPGCMVHWLEGNIDCDPEFCNPGMGNFYLADTSCCVGAGFGGVDIGAYGVGCPLSPGICGDPDASGVVDIDDVVYLIANIFSAGTQRAPLESSDANCSGGMDIDDVVYVINFIFVGGPAPCDPDGDGIPDC
jgi:parallel beta-helix repeat protein